MHTCSARRPSKAVPHSSQVQHRAAGWNRRGLGSGPGGCRCPMLHQRWGPPCGRWFPGSFCPHSSTALLPGAGGPLCLERSRCPHREPWPWSLWPHPSCPLPVSVSPPLSLAAWDSVPPCHRLLGCHPVHRLTVPHDCTHHPVCDLAVATRHPGLSLGSSTESLPRSQAQLCGGVSRAGLFTLQMAAFGKKATGSRRLSPPWLSASCHGCTPGAESRRLQASIYLIIPHQAGRTVSCMLDSRSGVSSWLDLTPQGDGPLVQTL